MEIRFIKVFTFDVDLVRDQIQSDLYEWCVESIYNSNVSFISNSKPVQKGQQSSYDICKCTFANVNFEFRMKFCRNIFQIVNDYTALDITFV